MAATTSTTPRRNGFDFAALAASAGTRGSQDEVARLRAAVETLSELVVAHGVMDARTLASLLGDLVMPPMQPVALSAPLPPPAPSAAEVRLKPAPKPTPVATRPAPVAAKPAPAPVAAKPQPAPVAAKPQPAPVAVTPAPVAVPAPAPVAAAPAPVAAAPAPVAAAPAPVAAAPAPVVAAAPAPVAAPVAVETPAPAPKKNPFAPTAIDAARLAAELTEVPPPSPEPAGFWGRLFGRKKQTSPAAVAAQAESIEFTERTPKLPADGLYAEQQRATELSFPPPSTVRKPRPTARKKSAARPRDAAPSKFCDRCWRRMDASGVCKTCSPSA